MSSSVAGAVLGERLARGDQQLLVVAARVGALGALREAARIDCGSAHGMHRLEKRRVPPYSNRRDTPDTSGGLLHFSANRPRIQRWLPSREFHARHAAPPARSSALRSSGPNTAAVLAIILATYLMIVLDISVIIAALPKIQSSLHFSPTGLSWVQSAYTLTFGGLLLLGARAGDILGRRRMLVAGVALFTLASLAGGLAPSGGWLLAARAVQGVGAAIAAPSTLALLTTTFREGPERTRAIAYYSAVAGGGGSVGLVLGGMLTDWISWRWGLFINVPVGLAVILLAPRFLPETPRSARATSTSWAP